MDADIGIVAMLARARLEARRRGEDWRVTGVSADLRALLELCGLVEIVGFDAAPAEPDRPA